MDEHYWQPGWRPADPAAWRSLQARLVADEAWIIDGNYLCTLELRLHAADTVVFLDLPRWRCAWRVTFRVLRGRGAANTAPGCPERFDRRHLRFLRYIWGFRRTARPQLLQHLEESGRTTTIVRLTTPWEVRRFEAELAR
jgi:adenylate kinase family enzyme